MMKKMKISNIGILANIKKTIAIKEVRNLCHWLQKRKYDYRLLEDLGNILDKPDKGLNFTRMADWADLMIVLGGDGTLLWGARNGAYGRNPVLGVNLGSLGFLVNVSIHELYPALTHILAGNYTIEKRMRLEAKVLRNQNSKNLTTVWQQTALNDAVISKETISRMIQLRISINHQLVTEYRADGLIISSPTGSTAHSLSAGGPIVHPSLNAMILTPICPHSFSNRPLLVDGSDVVEIEVINPIQNTYLTMDGQEGYSLRHKDIVSIRKSKKSLRLIANPNKDYFQVLHTKLNWGRR